MEWKKYKQKWNKAPTDIINVQEMGPLKLI